MTTGDRARMYGLERMEGETDPQLEARIREWLRPKVAHWRTNLDSAIPNSEQTMMGRRFRSRGSFFMWTDPPTADSYVPEWAEPLAKLEKGLKETLK